MSESRERDLERLIADRKQILSDLSRTLVSEVDSEEKQQKTIEERRLLKAKLAAINAAIKAAGGRLQGQRASLGA